MSPRKPSTPEKRKGYTGKKISIFFERALARRMELGLNQTVIAERMQVHQTRISEIEGGQFPNDPERIIALAYALETSPDYLFGFRDEP